MSADAATVEERWRGRPRAALALKTLIVALPLAASVVVSLFAAKRLPHPEGAMQITLWWISLMLISAVVLIMGEAIARRFLPLVALLRLSLLFPGAAPSRIGVARASTRSELRRLTAQVERDGLGIDLATVARTLVVLVGALDVHDRSTRGHSERVRVYADMLGEQLGLEDGERDRLRWAALLHDLGKLRIPIEVLHKRDNLSEEDWAIIHRHPEDGEKMLGPLREWLGEWALVVRHHHEHWDGNGYPDKLAGEDISLGARVVAVADSYDVMTSIRSYQPRARSAASAREELVACAGTQFDPALVRRFLGLSTRRLWMILGPLAWIAQLPVVGPVLTEAAVLTTGQAAVALGTATAARGGVEEFVASGRDRSFADHLDVGGEEPDEATSIPDDSATTSASSVVASTILAPTSDAAVPTTEVPLDTLAADASTTTATTTATTTTVPPPPARTDAPLQGIALRQRACAPGPAPAPPPTTVSPEPTAPATDAAPGPVTRPPQPRPDSASVAAGESVPIDVVANDTDPDGDLDPTTLAYETPPARGTILLLFDGSIAYTANPGESGTDRFVYTVLDEAGGCGEATVTVRIG